MQPTEIWNAREPARMLYGPVERRILVERQVGANTVVILGIRCQHVTQVCRVEDNQMIEALASD